MLQHVAVGDSYCVFFQAEDGIRDDLVTGVQTCALPIYKAQPMDESIRAYRDEVAAGLKDPNRRLIDVRSPQEFTGELLHMVNYPQEGAQRGGHIPTAKSIPWATAANSDGTFKSAEELR